MVTNKQKTRDYSKRPMTREEISQAKSRTLRMLDRDDLDSSQIYTARSMLSQLKDMEASMERKERGEPA